MTHLLVNLTCYSTKKITSYLAFEIFLELDLVE